ncbi:MAG: ribonuclease HII [Bacteroidales bacterium]|nr:ribonuclease HII [Bacteroidales bacterium]
MLISNFSGQKYEAGCDEAGRGCLAGPVVAAAVVFPENYSNDWINDSKQLSSAKRAFLRNVIESEALSFAVGVVEPEIIDKINILQASILAMHRALDQLSLKPNFIIVDGNKFKPWNDVSHETFVKGDGRFLSIAAASILAKTYRDDLMIKLHNDFPVYQWNNNMGYPTKAHREAILKYGNCVHHRKSFNISNQLTINF